MKKQCSAGALILLLLASPAHAYVRMRTPDGIPLAWRDGCPAFTVVASGNDALPADVLVAQIERARDAWQGGSGGCARLPVEAAAADRRASVEYDGASQLLWRDASYCEQPGNETDEVCLSPNAAAVTTVFFYERGERAGEIVETDMEINGQFVFGVDGESDRVDLLSAVTHELGHALGLEHTCETIPGRAPLIDSTGATVPSCFPTGSLPEPIRAATMYPFIEVGELRARAPVDDERMGVCDLFRDRAAVCQDTGPGCGCESGAGGATAGVLLVVLALVRRVRTSLRSRR
jgi:hypothetical protein